MFLEDDGEKIKMHMRKWISLKEQNSDLSRSEFIQQVMHKISDRYMIYILDNTDLYELMCGIQHKMPVPWMISPTWGINWL